MPHRPGEFAIGTQQQALARQDYSCASCGTAIFGLGQTGRSSHLFDEGSQAHHDAASLLENPLAASHQGDHAVVGVGAERIHRGPGGGGRLRPVTQAVQGGQERPSGEGLNDVQISRLLLPRPGAERHGPFQAGCGPGGPLILPQGTHFFTETVVPLPI